MLLAIEIMLSISAWKRGWKGWVLMPWVALFFGATALGGAAASQEEALAVGIVCDILLIVVLGIMTATARGSQTEPNVSSQSEQEPESPVGVSTRDNR